MADSNEIIFDGPAPKSSEPKEIELDAKPPKEIDHNSIWEDIKEGTVERTKKLGEALTDYKGERGFSKVLPIKLLVLLLLLVILLQAQHR